MAPSVVCVVSVIHLAYFQSLLCHIASRLIAPPISDTHITTIKTMSFLEPVRPVFASSIDYDAPFAPLPEYLKGVLRGSHRLIAAEPEDHSSRFELLPSEPDTNGLLGHQDELGTRPSDPAVRSEVEQSGRAYDPPAMLQAGDIQGEEGHVPLDTRGRNEYELLSRWMEESDECLGPESVLADQHIE